MFRLGVVPTEGDLEVKEHEQYRGRLSIPYLTKGGVVNIKFRCIKDHDCKAEHCVKYLGLAGRNNLYNVSALFNAGDTIAICEGEMDSLVLSMSGVPAVGVPGATNWQQHYRYIFDDFTRVVAFMDGDEAGKKMGALLAEKLKAIVVTLPTGQDVNSMILEGRLEWLTSKM